MEGSPVKTCTIPDSGLMSDVVEVPETALYRLYAANGDLLYVGIAYDPRVRWAQHRADKAWWPEVYRYALEWHPTRSRALKVEKDVIARERPRHNVHGAAEAPGSSEAATSDPDALLTIKGVCERHGITRQGLHSHRQHPDFPAPIAEAGHSRPRWRAALTDRYFLAHPKSQGARTDLKRKADAPINTP